METQEVAVSLKPDEATKISVVSSDDWHAMTVENIAQALNTNLETGITKPEAAERLKKFGPNAMTPPKPRTLLQMIWENFSNIVTYILLGSAIVAGIFNKWPDLAMILIVIVCNTALGVIQEGKAEKATRAISAMVSATALVTRNGKKYQIPANQLVKGDIVNLTAGDRIPADVRWIEVSSLQVTEAVLTGESAPITKTVAPVPVSAGLGDQSSMGFSSTLVFTGQGSAIVVATGDNAAIGKINKLMTETKAEKTPLLIQINSFGKRLSLVCLLLALATFFIAFFGRGIEVDTSLTTAISVAVALIPEGLGIVVTITLSAGVQAMSKHQAIIRQLPAVETLGSVTVICSDKTGTLTRNEMTAVSIHAPGHSFRVTGTGYQPEGEVRINGSGDELSPDQHQKNMLRQLLLPAALCNDSTLMPTNSHIAQHMITTQPVNMPFLKTEAEHKEILNNQEEVSSLGVGFTAGPGATRIIWNTTGDPTEAALLALAMKSGLNLRTLNELSHNLERIDTLPFNSDTKIMGTLFDIPVDPSQYKPENIAATNESDESATPAVPTRRVVMIKGAPEVLLPRCATQASKLNPWSKEDFQLQHWLNIAASLSKEGLRVLALCHAEFPSDRGTVSSDMILAGIPMLQFHCLVGIIDPPREDATEAVAVCQSAGVQVRMITGDHHETARTIAGWMGIPNGKVLTGTQLQAMSDDELLEAVKDCCVFARATPEHKLRIVKALQKRKEVVAMTGDGVNDAPALKAANVGVALGITGTEVAKEASKMILVTDNFAAIAAAVRQGRGSYSNIIKQLCFLLPTSAAQGLSIAVAIAIGVDPPLTGIQVLWINMVTAATLGLVIGIEEPEEGVMKQMPRRPGKALVSTRVLWRTLYVGIAMIAVVLGNAEWTLAISETPAADKNRAHAVALNTLVALQSLYVISCRYENKSAFRLEALTTNPWLTAMIFLNAGLQSLITYVPALQPVFDTQYINGEDWARVIGLAFAVFLLVEFEKYVFPRYVWKYLKPAMKRFKHTFCRIRGSGKSSRDVTEATAAASAYAPTTPIVRTSSLSFSH